MTEQKKKWKAYALLFEFSNACPCGFKLVWHLLELFFGFMLVLRNLMVPISPFSFFLIKKNRKQHTCIWEGFVQYRERCVGGSLICAETWQVGFLVMFVHPMGKINSSVVSLVFCQIPLQLACQSSIHKDDGWAMELDIVNCCYWCFCILQLLKRGVKLVTGMCRC